MSLAAGLLAGCISPSESPSESQAADSELEGVRAASAAYFEAWTTNDPDAVMATFTDNPVLSPSGMPSRRGRDEARAFWWPTGYPPTTVTRFDHEVLEVDRSGELAYVRGTYVLEFEYDGDEYVNVGKFLHLLSRGPESGWRISHHLWNDLPRPEQP